VEQAKSQKVNISSVGFVLVPIYIPRNLFRSVAVGDSTQHVNGRVGVLISHVQVQGDLFSLPVMLTLILLDISVVLQW